MLDEFYLWPDNQKGTRITLIVKEYGLESQMT